MIADKTTCADILMDQLSITKNTSEMRQQSLLRDTDSVV